MVLIHYLLFLFGYQRKLKISTVCIQKNGSIKIAYRKKQLRKIYKMEHEMSKKSIGFENELIPFEDFFVDVLPEAVLESFYKQCILWKHYHQILFHKLTGSKEILRFDNYGVHFAAIEASMIIRFSEKYVIINLPRYAHEIISMRICQEAIRLASCKGLDVCFLDCKLTGSKFSVKSDMSMIHYEVFSIDGYYGISRFDHST